MTTYTFRVCHASVQHRFTCPCCGKSNRVRTFRVEHTVNPFNVHSDGTMKTPAEVQRGAASEAKMLRAQFITEPLCATCENNLSWADRRALTERRQTAYAAE